MANPAVTTVRQNALCLSQAAPTTEGWEKEFEELFTITNPNAGNLLLRYTDAEQIKSFITTLLAKEREIALASGFSNGRDEGHKEATLGLNHKEWEKAKEEGRKAAFSEVVEKIDTLWGKAGSKPNQAYDRALSDLRIAIEKRQAEGL